MKDRVVVFSLISDPCLADGSCHIYTHTYTPTSPAPFPPFPHPQSHTNPPSTLVTHMHPLPLLSPTCSSPCPAHKLALTCLPRQPHTRCQRDDDGDDEYEDDAIFCHDGAVDIDTEGKEEGKEEEEDIRSNSKTLASESIIVVCRYNMNRWRRRKKKKERRELEEGEERGEYDSDSNKKREELGGEMRGER